MSMILPLVSILIPTYNRPHYLEQALRSALAQTYPRIEVIISDNSNNLLTQQVVQRIQSEVWTNKIRYVKNQKNVGPVANQQQCLKLARGQYVNYLMDDDLFDPLKIERMATYLMKFPRVKLVTSRKNMINNSNQVISLLPESVPHVNFSFYETFVNGRAAMAAMLKSRMNFIGEPTSGLFRKADLKEPFGVYYGQPAFNNVDVATWLNLLTHGDMVFLTDPLCAVRSHPAQISVSPLSEMGGVCDWIDHILLATHTGILQVDEEWVQTILTLKTLAVQHFPVWNAQTNQMFKKQFVSRTVQLADICHVHAHLHPAGRELRALLTRI